eukprot:5778625-Prymnesium_polylepis.2
MAARTGSLALEYWSTKHVRELASAMPACTPTSGVRRSGSASLPSKRTRNKCCSEYAPASRGDEPGPASGLPRKYANDSPPAAAAAPVLSTSSSASTTH